MIKGHVQELFHGLEKECVLGKILDLNLWYNWIAFDVVADAAFGKPFKCLTDATYRKWPILLSKTCKVVVYSSGLKYVIPRLLLWAYPSWILQAEVENRIESVASRGDLMSSIVQHNGVKPALTKEEIISNASLFIFAGTETVASILPALTYMLTQNPEAKTQLTSDIGQEFGEEESIMIQALS